MTIHVTPEDGFSYASVEMCCYDLGIMGPDPQAIVRQVRQQRMPGAAARPAACCTGLVRMSDACCHGFWVASPAPLPPPARGTYTWDTTQFHCSFPPTHCSFNILFKFTAHFSVVAPSHATHPNCIQVLDIFGPKQASVSLSIDGAAKQPWADAFAVPTGYSCHSASLQDLRGGGYVAYFVLGAMQRYVKHLPSDASGLDSVASLAAALPEARPPRGILTALPSYGILSSCGADSDGEHSSASDSLASSLMLHNGAEPDDGSGSRTPSPRPDCSSALYQALAMVDATVVPEGQADAFAAGVINRLGLEDSFYVYDLGALARLHQTWTAAMPRVTPYYAVKCNMDTGLLR